MVSRGVKISVGLLLLTLAGAGALMLTKRTTLQPVSESDLATLVPLDKELATFFPLDLNAEPTGFAGSAEERPLHLARAFKRWEIVAGLPHLRLETYANHRLMTVAWLRPETTAEGVPQLVCSQRQVGTGTFTLSPPQPILQGPLETGAAWTWSGHVGEDPCRADFKILRRERQNGVEVLEIEQVTTLDGPGRQLVSRRTQIFAAGRGLISEDGTTAAHQPTRRTDVEVRATALDPSEPKAD